MAELIFDNDLCQGLLDDRGGEVLLVTFNELHFEANAQNYWAELVGRSLGISCLGIVAKQMNWFPPEGLGSEVLRIRAVASRFSEVILYGFSQGAYAAIKYSRLFSASVVLSFSPQYSIDPSVTGQFDQRFSRYFDARLHKDMSPRTVDVAGRILLFADPHHRPDNFNATLIRSAVRAEWIRCHYVGHGTVRPISSTPAMREILGLRHAGAQDIEDAVHRLKRAHFFYYMSLSRVSLARGKVRLADELCRRAEGLSTDPRIGALRRDIVAAGVPNRR